MYGKGVLIGKGLGLGLVGGFLVAMVCCCWYPCFGRRSDGNGYSDV